MFIDELKLHLKAGNGGNGVVRWLHEKGKEYGGPAGGNGGNGGDIHARATRDISILSSYRTVKKFTAERGEDGKNKNMYGKNGEDLYIDFPIGSLIKNLQTGKTYELLTEGETVLLLKGGRGGLGNEHFKASTNVRPTESTPGKIGEEGNFTIELNLIADIGLIGLPNAGKSSLLNALTNAEAKVGSYAFTTLEPNLGALYGFILADIPGLIEGASSGKGLGHKFLRHIKRTGMLIHCISLEEEDSVGIYKTIREELRKFDPVLLDKKEVILLTKTDVASKEKIADTLKKMKKVAEDPKLIFTISVYDLDAIKKFRDSLVKLLEKESVTL